MIDSVFDFLHNYQPKPEIFSLGFFSLRWYGLFLVLVIFFGLKLSFFWAKQYKIWQEKFWSLAFYLIILGIFSARLYHILSEFSYYQNQFWQVFFIWRGGLGFYGALILGIIFLFFWAKKNKVSFSALADLTAPSLALGEIFIRFGNYFNQEIFGRPTDLPWGIPIERQNRLEPYLESEYFHPVFLYQILASFLIFIVLMLLSRSLAKKIKNGQSFVFGQIFIFYLIFASLVRFFLEFLRIDPQPIIFGLRLGQTVSLCLLIFGFSILIYLREKKEGKFVNSIEVGTR